MALIRAIGLILINFRLWLEYAIDDIEFVLKELVPQDASKLEISVHS